MLALPSIGPKLPDLECAALLSLPPVTDWPAWVEGLGGCSWGIAVLPMGVARCSVGSVGRAGAAAAAAPTGLTFGEGGMASPSLGARAPPGLAPGIAGRSRGAGAEDEDMLGIGLADGLEALGAFIAGDCQHDEAKQDVVDRTQMREQRATGNKGKGWCTTLGAAGSGP